MLYRKLESKTQCTQFISASVLQILVVQRHVNVKFLLGNISDSLGLPVPYYQILTFRKIIDTDIVNHGYHGIRDKS